MVIAAGISTKAFFYVLLSIASDSDCVYMFFVLFSYILICFI